MARTTKRRYRSASSVGKRRPRPCSQRWRGVISLPRVGHQPALAGLLPARHQPRARRPPQIADRTSRTHAVPQRRAARQRPQHRHDRCPAALPTAPPAVRARQHGHGRHSQPRRDLLSLPLLQSPTDPGQPTAHLQPPSLRSPPTRIPALPPVLLGPPHLPLRGILRRPEQRRLPRRPATVSFPQQFSACAVRHYRHPSVRIVPGCIQRVAPLPMHTAPHHRHRVARPGRTARSCAFGSDRRTLRTSAPPWRRRNVTAARRVGFRPHPPRSSSSRAGARVPRLRLGTLAASRVPRLAVVSRRPGCKSVKPAALTLRASHFMPRSLLRLRHPHRIRYSLTPPLGPQRNTGHRCFCGHYAADPYDDA